MLFPPPGAPSGRGMHPSLQPAREVLDMGIHCADRTVNFAARAKLLPDFPVRNGNNSPAQDLRAETDIACERGPRTDVHNLRHAARPLRTLPL